MTMTEVSPGSRYSFLPDRRCGVLQDRYGCPARKGGVAVVRMISRYGIAEWYGLDFANLSPERIREIASDPPKICPFRYPSGKCNKRGGVCSLRKYSEIGATVTPVDQSIVTT